MKLLLPLLLFIACNKLTDPEVSDVDFKPKKEIDKTAYAIGTKYARAIQELGMDDQSNKFFIKGIEDYFNGEVDFSDEEINIYALRVDDIIAYKRAESAKDEKTKGEQFVEALMARDPKFLRSKSGLVYKVFKKGQKVNITDKTFIKLSYRSFHLDGKKYEGTPKGEPREMPYLGILKAWQEAFKIAGANSSVIIYAPPSLTYGDTGAAPYIKPGEYLKYQIRFYGAVEKTNE